MCCQAVEYIPMRFYVLCCLNRLHPSPFIAELSLPIICETERQPDNILAATCESFSNSKAEQYEGATLYSSSSEGQSRQGKRCKMLPSSCKSSKRAFAGTRVISSRRAVQGQGGKPKDNGFFRISLRSTQFPLLAGRTMESKSPICGSPRVCQDGIHKDLISREVASLTRARHFGRKR